MNEKSKRVKGPINGDIPRKQVTDLEHKLRQWQYCCYYYYQYYYLLLLLKYQEPHTPGLLNPQINSLM